MSISAAQRTRLGVFMITGVVLLAIFIAIPLGIKLNDKYKSYVAFFKGESLSGLEQGAVVKFSGVPIGKVEKIKYFPDDLSKVKVELKIQNDFPMKTDMVATTGAMGITGLKYIEITGGSNKAALLKEGSEIPTKISLFSTITGKAEMIVAKVELLLNHLNEISDPDSLRSFKEILDNVAQITGDVKGFVGETRPKVSNITESTQQIIGKVDSIASDIQSFTSTFNASVPPEKLALTFSRIDSTAASLKQLSDQLSLMVRQSREDFTASMENIREASENANQLTKIVAENPSLLLRGEAQKERDIR